MNWFKNLKLRAKLLAVTTAITFAALVAATTVHLLYHQQTARVRLIAAQQVLARVLADRSTAALAFADPRVAGENLAALEASPAVEEACIYDTSAGLFAAWRRDAAGPGCPDPLPALVPGLADGTLRLVQPISVDGARIGTLTLRASLAGLAREARTDLLVAASVLIGALALAMLSAGLLQRLVSRPIVRLAETTALITRSQDFTIEAAAGGRDEVGQLVQAFNSMLAAIRGRDDSLRRSEARFRALVEGISAILYTTAIGPGGATLYISPQLERILGFPPEDWTCRPDLFARQLHEEDRERVLGLIAESQRRGTALVCEYRMYHRKGHVVWIRDEAEPIRDETGQAILMQGLRYDISERKRAEAAVEHLAYHDALTDLPNRRLFKDRLKLTAARAARNGQQFAVHFLDLDNFKDINDSLGHPVGDTLLQRVAERFLEIVRRSDTFARFGGDEFAAIQEAVAGIEDASILAQRFIDALRIPFYVDEDRIQVGTCVGVVVASGEVADVDVLMTRADVALYKAKAAGANQFAFFEDSMTAQLQREMALTTQLPEAIGRGELFLEYQPQVALETGQVVGLEALARWRHPRFGMVPPMEFIPLAEKHGLIVELGAWVLAETCRQAAAWLAAGIAPRRIAVNVSPVQLRSDSFVDTVMERLGTHDIRGDMLELEFTETVFLEATDENLRVIAELSARGVQFSIDDFGTGFSSLAYLRRFQVDKLKIDRTFVQNLVENPSDAEIVRATLTLAHALGLATIAEGVETEAQAELLRRLGCAEAQGYLFGRPMAAAAATDYLAAHAASAFPAP